MKSWSTLGIRIAVCLLACGLQGQAQENTVSENIPDPQFATVAEQTDFADTARETDAALLMRRLANSWDAAELTTIGNTVEGRPLWALVIEPLVQSDSKPITVLMLGGIHSGECDGKEALLALAADMAQEQQATPPQAWWQSLRLIFVPNFNADANERRGALHRPGQAGPLAGMGVRENAQDLDLNRDFVKLESPEVRGLVTAINDYDVDVLIDTHTTNGSLHRYELTYDIPHIPTLPSDIDGYLRRVLIPGVTQRVAEAGFSTFYYGNFDREHRRWDTYGHEARYSTEYMGLRGRIGILAESYSYAPYKTRVLASYAFVHEVLRKLADDAPAVRKMIDEAAQQVQPGQPLHIRGRIAKTADAVPVLGYATAEGNPPQAPFGADATAALEDKEYSVQLWNRGEAVKSVSLPTAYAVAPQYAWALSRLALHGVQLKRLTQPLSLAGEQLKLTSVDRQPNFQGHQLLSLETTPRAGQLELAKGTYIVETSQPLGMLAGYLLEPESDDSLAKWNFFDPDIAADSDYPVARVLESIPAELLVEVQGVAPSEQITLENLMKPGQSVNYSGASMSTASWLKNSTEYLLKKNNRYYAVDAATGSMRPYGELEQLRAKLAELDAFSDEQAQAAARLNVFSDAGTHALLEHEQDLYYFDAQATVARQLTHSPEQEEQFATLSPTGDRVAFVRENDVWVVDCQTTELRRITQDGSSELLNGVLDWVYQEELYGRGNFKAFWWSPDGKRIAFLQLDQTPVPSYQVSDSISFGQSLEATRYPKSGEALPLARVWLADLESDELIEVDLSAFPIDDRLVARVTWSPAGELWLQVFNRVQNQQNLVRVDPASGKSQILFTEVSPGWLEVRGTPEFLPDGDFLWLSDLPAGRTHLYRVEVDTGRKSALTEGDWDVDSLLCVSTDGTQAFVSGNLPNPIESHLICIGLESGEVKQITAAPGSHRVSLHPSGQFYLDTFSNLDTQTFTAVHRIDGALLRVLEAPTSDRHAYLNIRPPRLLTIAARDGSNLQAMLMLPADFDPQKSEHKLPVLFHVYGGPQAPTIRNAWQSGNYWWHQFLCQRGFAVVLCDNRAARGRGVKDTWTIRGDLGRVELQDLEDAVQWVNQQPWADAKRVGLWGWSYGGYFTSYALTHSKLFAAGIAGAPVTDWHNYDAIYTERYMDLPQNNKQGYQSSSSVAAAANLHGRLLIIHGERDDNVHISNSFQLAYALQQAGRQFELMVYPKNRHGIVDPAQRFHMHQLMLDFLEKNLKPQD